MDVSINWIAVIAAAISNMAIGFAWYSDSLFGKQWRKLGGISQGKPTKNQMTNMMVLGIGSALLMAYVLSNAIVYAGSYLGAQGLALGLMAGFWNFLGFVFPLLLTGYLYEKKPINYVFINGGFWLLSMLVMGVIIALWR